MPEFTSAQALNQALRAEMRRNLKIVATTDHEAFVVWYLNDGRPPASSTVLDKAVGKRTTTRFFHTTAKILAAARKV